MTPSGARIRTHTTTLSRRLSPQTKSIRRSFRRRVLKSRKRFVRYSLITVNVALLVGVVIFVATSSPATKTNKQNALAIVAEDSASPLDELSSADIAAHVASIARLDEAVSVKNNADSVNAQLSMSPADEKIVAKTQVVSTAIKSYRDIKEYTVQPGETITGIAEKFGITSNSIRWSNSLSGNTIDAGKVILIPPVNGLVYTVKNGDTPDSLATRYNANKQAIVEFNDAEVSGLAVGQRIMIPDGIQPVARTATVSSGFAWGGYSPIYGGNGYDYGYCTWYAAIKRAQIGRPVPSNLGNASTWLSLGARAGLATGATPQPGAVIWTPPRDWYGHVGFVESVGEDGSVVVSEMNVVGWGRVSSKTLTAEQASAYRYIY